MGKVIEQLNRTKRWHEKIKLILVSELPTKEIDENNRDIIYAFFQNCYHIKDWVISSFPLKKSAVEEFIQSNNDLKICRDICNGSKHLKLNNYSVDPNISNNLHGRFYSISINNNVRTEVIYFATVNNRSVDVVSVAANCLVLWETFLIKEGIISN